MTKSVQFRRALATILAISLGAVMVPALQPQPQGGGGASAFQGQDIMGGAAIVFKRPQRVRDMVGGAAMLVVKRSPKPPTHPTEVARTTPDRRRPRPRPGETPIVEPKLSDADKGEAFKNQGNTYYDLGDFPKAIEAYLNALKFTPRDPVIYNNLGAAYFSSNKNNEAADAFKKSLTLKPNDADAYFNLGIAYSSIENHDEAVNAFKEAVRVKPNWGEAYNALGDSYLSLNRFAEAAKAYEQAVRIQPDNAVSLTIGWECCHSRSRLCKKRLG